MSENENSDSIEEIKNQVSILTRYIKVLQDKVKALEEWKFSTQPAVARKPTFSDFGNRDISAPEGGSALGKSIADMTAYPHRHIKPE